MVVWALFSLLYRIGLLTIAIAFTAQTSRGDKAVVKLGKFLGLVVSIVPLFALFFYLGFKGRPSGYGEKCGVMGLLGVLLYGLITAEQCCLDRDDLGFGAVGCDSKSAGSEFDRVAPRTSARMPRSDAKRPDDQEPEGAGRGAVGRRGERRWRLRPMGLRDDRRADRSAEGPRRGMRADASRATHDPDRAFHEHPQGSQGPRVDGGGEA